MSDHFPRDLGGRLELTDVLECKYSDNLVGRQRHRNFQELRTLDKGAEGFGVAYGDEKGYL